MKHYDIYLAMAPGGEAEEYMGQLAVLLLNSGLKYTRHIGKADNIAARRDVRRLLDECSSVLYIANEANNSLDLAVDVVERANKAGMEIVVVRTDKSPYPEDVAQILQEAPTYDATNPATRRQTFGDAIRRLGGKIDIEPAPATAAPEPSPAETNPADSSTSANTTSPTDTLTAASGPAYDPDEHTGKQGQSLSVIILEIILAIIVIAGVAAIIF